MPIDQVMTGQNYSSSASCSAIIHQRQASAPALISYEEFEPQQQHFTEGTTQQQQQQIPPSSHNLHHQHMAK